MKINYTKNAFEALNALVIFIEKENTKGAGTRWLDKFETFLIQSLNLQSVINLCHNKTLRQLHLKCLNYNDWVIAFSVKDTTVVIEAFLHKSRIND